MKEKDPQKIEAIFRATLELTCQKGIYGLKMSEIAKQANIAIGTLYIYFSSKEELLNNLYRTIKLSQNCFTDELQKEIPLKVKFKNIWENSIKYWVSHHMEKVFLEQFYYSSLFDEESQTLSQSFQNYFFELFDLGKKDMIIKDLDNELLLCACYGFLKEIVTYCTKKNLEVSGELINRTFDIFWDSLKA